MSYRVTMVEMCHKIHFPLVAVPTGVTHKHKFSIILLFVVDITGFNFFM